MMDNTEIDITIIGGGIAGLWTLNRLRQQGYQAILIEKGDLGGDQTCASQGIIHGGTKYALTGILSDSAKAISAMPRRWLDAIEGNGEIDLTGVSQLASHQFLWTENDIATRLTGFFASKVMQSKMALVETSKQPEFFHQSYQSNQFKGNVYQLNEPVINTQELVDVLYQRQQKAIFKGTIHSITKNKEDSFTLNLDELSITSKKIVLTAGNGNQDLYQQFFPKHDFPESYKPVMQQRPLQMLLLKGKEFKGKQLKPIYAHRLGVSALPTMTISSHKLSDSDPDVDNVIWYIGGELAEKYATKPQAELISAAKEQLNKLIPWQNFNEVKWSSIYINRAEPLMSGGQRPDNQFVSIKESTILAWPVKLALTPLLADDICKTIADSDVQTQNKELPIELNNLSKPAVTKMPWEKIDNWSD